jgi:hypothetical protein
VSDLSRYFEFTVSVSNGYFLTLQDVDFWQRSGPSRITNFVVRTSVDGFSSDVVSSPPPGGFSWENTAATMGGATYDVLTDPVTVRLYGQGASSSSQWQIDHIVVNGTVNLIPEASTTGLLILGLGSVFLFRRRAHRHPGRPPA